MPPRDHISDSSSRAAMQPIAQKQEQLSPPALSASDSSHMSRAIPDESLSPLRSEENAHQPPDNFSVSPRAWRAFRVPLHLSDRHSLFLSKQESHAYPASRREFGLCL